jgi:hypothetical protein
MIICRQLDSRGDNLIVVKHEQLIGLESDTGVGPSAVIAEFHFENARSEDLDDRSNLTANQAFRGQIVQKSNRGQQLQVHFLQAPRKT